MKLLSHAQYSPYFKSEICDGGDDEKPSPNNLLMSISKNIGPDTYHPIRIKTAFHPNGHLSSIDIEYKNGKFATGQIHEKYDENGKNINYEA